MGNNACFRFNNMIKVFLETLPFVSYFRLPSALPRDTNAILQVRFFVFFRREKMNNVQ